MVAFTKKRAGWFIIASFITLLTLQLGNLKPAKAATLTEYGVTNKDSVQDAISSVEWIDATNIKVKFRNSKEINFALSASESDTKPSNLRNHRFEASGTVFYGNENPSLKPCFAALKFNAPSGSETEILKKTITSVVVDIDFRPNPDTDCEDGNEPNINTVNPANSIAYFKWSSPNQITTVDSQNPDSFTIGTTEVTINGTKYEVFMRDKEVSSTECRDKLVLNRSTNQVMWYELDDKYDGNPPDEISTTCGFNESAVPRNNELVRMSNTSEAVKDVPLSTGGGESGGTGPVGTECEDRFSTFGIITCWILDGIDSILELIENTVANLLEVDTANFTTSENGVDTPLYTAWLGVVRVSSGLLAIVAIAMVLGTALGGYRVFDAYTVKKVLPRIVIAAIAMWLSWALVTAYIDAMNTIGRGIADLMWEPFASTEGSFEDYGLAQAFGNASTDTGGGTEAVAGLTIIGVIAGAGVIAGSAWALLSALIPVLLFMLVGFVVLILRQSIIVFLIVMAPFAIVSWVLPNTKSIWDKWSKFLNQLLFMFPMFMAILAAGKIFSNIASQSNDKGLFSLLIPVIAYITPFALLPSIFKSAGGALSKVTGTVSKIGGRATGGAQKTVQGFSDARKKVRAEDRVARGRVAQGSGYRVPFTEKRIASSAAIARAAQRARVGQSVIPISSESRSAAALGASRVSQEQISAIQKDIDQVLGGDLEARKAIASGETLDQIRASKPELASRLESSGASRFIGDRYAQAGATMGLASIGKVDESHIRKAAVNFSEDQQTSSAIVSQASRAAKSAGQTSLGSLRYDYASGGVGYEGMVTNPVTGTVGKGIAIEPRLDANGNPTNPEYITARNESVAKSIASMSAIDQAGLAVDGGAFKDTVVTEALGSNPALATQILNDENVKLTASQRQALLDVGAIENPKPVQRVEVISGGPSQPSNGVASTNQSPPNPPSGGGLNLPPNSSTGGDSFS